MLNAFKILGILFGFLGSVIIAFSVEENPGGANQMINGKKIPLASINLTLFRLGVLILTLGFLVQLVSIFWDF